MTSSARSGAVIHLSAAVRAAVSTCATGPLGLRTDPEGGIVGSPAELRRLGLKSRRMW